MTVETVEVKDGGAKAPLSVFVAVPSGDGKLCVQATVALIKAQQVCQNNGIEYAFRFEVGLCYISMARNNLIAKFMESACTDLVFVDSDIGFSPESFMALLACDVDVVAGIYPKKNDKVEWPVVLKTDEFHRPYVKDGLILAESLPTGFMKIKRGAIEKLMKAHPELKYSDANTGKDTYDLFGTFVENGRWFGDDYGFCHLWGKLGGDCFVLPNVDFTHVGIKNFKGNFHAHLMALPPATTEPQPVREPLNQDAIALLVADAVDEVANAIG